MPCQMTGIRRRDRFVCIKINSPFHRTRTSINQKYQNVKIGAVLTNISIYAILIYP